MDVTSSTITIEHSPRFLLAILQMEHTTKSANLRFMGAQHKDITERTVLYRVHRTARKVTVTSRMGPVWGVLMDTRVQLVMNNATANRTVKSVSKIVETVKTMNSVIM